VASGTTAFVTGRVKTSTNFIDICSVDGGITPSDDPTEAIQSAMTDLVNTGYGGAVRISTPGLYTMEAEVQTGSVTPSGGSAYSYAGQVLIPGTPYSTQSCIPLVIEGTDRVNDGETPNVNGNTGAGQAAGSPNGVVLYAPNLTAGQSIFDTIPAENGWGYDWTGVMPIFRNLVLRSPNNPLNNGLNLLNCLRCELDKVIFDCEQSWAAPTNPSFACLLPQKYNNGDILIHGAVHGYYRAFQVAEHAVFSKLYAENCYSVFYVKGAAGGSGNHAIYLGYVDTEEVGNIFEINDAYAVFHGHVDFENGSSETNFPVANFASLVAAGTLAGSVALNTVYPSRGGLGIQSDGNAANHMQMSVKNLQQGMAESQALHPYDSFNRQGKVLAPGQAPGLAWPTFHPWNTLAGAFTVNASGELFCTTTIGQTFVPVKGPAGEPRTVSESVTIGSSYDVAVIGSRLSSAECLYVRAHSGNVTMGIGNVGSGLLGTATGVVTASSTITLGLEIHYRQGLPYLLKALLNGVVVLSSILTPANQALITPSPGSAENPYLRDGIWMNDLTSYVTAFSVTPLEQLATLNSGVATLVAGTVTVPDPNITANSLIRPSRQAPGGTVGELGIPTLTAGTSFTITSSSSADTSKVLWEVVSY
jgi:hypothetical protein